ncbi:MAG: complex I subunit 1 family protein [Acidobacteriota bacterium]|jgi:NADH-quinone oxidoreductase subunit H
MTALLNTVYALALLILGTFISAVVEQIVKRRRVSVGAFGSFARTLTRPDPGHKRIDRVLFFASPAVALSAVALSLLVIPYAGAFSSLPAPQWNVGLFFYLVVLDYMAVALFMAGWGANQEKGTEAALMSGAQLISYIVPLGFSVTGVAMAAQTLAASNAIYAQRHLWYIVWQPLGFAIYIISAMAQTYRPPADLPLRPNANAFVEYEGAAGAILKLALHGIWFAAASMAVVLFLGGFRGPLLPGIAWFSLKVVAVLFLMAWLGTRFKRFSLSQMVRGAWLVMIPASIVNVIIVGVILILVKH